MSDLFVGRNNQRALRRMVGHFHPVQCASLIAPYLILSTVWREFQKIRYAVCSELPWLHFRRFRAGGNPAIVGCGDEGTASPTPILTFPLKGKGRLPLPFQGGGWEGDGLILAIDAVRKLTTSYGSLSMPWREFQEIRYTLCRELPLRYFTMLKSFRSERAA